MAKNLGAKELLQGLFSVPKEERQRASLLFGWLFLFITTYYVLRPVRRGIVLDGLGNDNMCFVYMGTALVTGLTVYIYSRFAHLPRRVLIGTIYSVFFLNLLGFYFALPGGGSLMAGVFCTPMMFTTAPPPAHSLALSRPEVVWGLLPVVQ
jgi:ATP/ADP translocase